VNYILRPDRFFQLTGISGVCRVILLFAWKIHNCPKPSRFSVENPQFSKIQSFLRGKSTIFQFPVVSPRKIHNFPISGCFSAENPQFSKARSFLRGKSTIPENPPPFLEIFPFPLGKSTTLENPPLPRDYFPLLIISRRVDRFSAVTREHAFSVNAPPLERSRPAFRRERRRIDRVKSV